jgi:hypothetical protein
VRITEHLLEMEARFTGGGPLPPPHLHPRQEEHFEILDGAVRVVINGVQKRYAAGESFDVPAGTVHQMGGDGPARLIWQVRPALKAAQLAEDLYTGVAAADPAAFLARYANEICLVEQHDDR